MLGVATLSTTSLAVVFDVAPSAFDVQAWYSATNTANFTLAAEVSPPPPFIGAARQPTVAIAEPDTDYPTQVVLTTDVTLEPRTRLAVTVSSSLRGAQGETLAGDMTWGFAGLELPPDPLTPLQVREDQYRDLDYVVFGPEGTPTQVYRFQANGDFALQGGAASLQKRIYRRIFAQPGDYPWAPNYGVGVAVSALARGGRLQELASTVAEQIRLEPDVADASAEVRVDRRETGAFVLVDLAVLRTDRATFRFGFSQPI